MMKYTIDSIIKEDIKICQPQLNGFRFGCDSVILAYFANMKSKWNVADVGSGSGVIAALCAKMYDVNVTAVELQDIMFECLNKTVDLCELQQKITTIQSNIKDFRTKKRFDAVICNPPYRKMGTGKVSASEEERIARFSYEMDLDTLLNFCRINLKHGGKLFFSYDADMLAEAISKSAQSGLEPKRLRLVYPDIKSKAKLMVVECVFGGGSEIIIEQPLFQKGNGETTKEYETIFKGEWKR